MFSQRNRNLKAFHPNEIEEDREIGKMHSKTPSSHFFGKRLLNWDVLSSNSVQKQYILDLIVSPGFYHPHMHISTEAIVEQHQCNITVALYYIIARYYSRVESLLASLSVWLIFLFFFSHHHFEAKSTLWWSQYLCSLQSTMRNYCTVTWNPIHQIQSQTSFHDPILVFGSLYIEAKLSLNESSSTTAIFPSI